MPCWLTNIRPQRRWCERAYSWSTYRGGCRLAPGRGGPCKPGRHRR